jgi:hypothetical protein
MTPEAVAAKRELLFYLIGIAQKTEGAEVWRALFAGMLAGTPESVVKDSFTSDALTDLDGLENRCYNALTAAGIQTISGCIEMKRSEMLRMKNMGPVTLGHFAHLLVARGVNRRRDWCYCHRCDKKHQAEGQ